MDAFDDDDSDVDSDDEDEEAALQAERRGQDANFAEANRLIEDLVKKYPSSDLVFYARLKQGDLLRKLIAAAEARCSPARRSGEAAISSANKSALRGEWNAAARTSPDKSASRASGAARPGACSHFP